MVSFKDIGENPRVILVLLRKYWMLVLGTALLGTGLLSLTINMQHLCIPQVFLS